jgi:uncharacterized protein
MQMQLAPLLTGPAASAKVLRLSAPISFWGGVDPATGIIIDARHPDRGTCISGVVLALPGTIGSSSASAVLLELVRRGIAPVAILMPEPDPILLVGLIVAREMGWLSPPAWRCPLDAMHRLDGHQVMIDTHGSLTVQP